jgi:hypothetical protein
LGDLEAAWEAVHDVTPPGWFVGRPSYHDERHEWTQFAFDQRERPSVGVSSREWTAVAATEVECLREMARGQREIGRRPGAAVVRDGRRGRRAD